MNRFLLSLIISTFTLGLPAQQRFDQLDNSVLKKIYRSLHKSYKRSRPVGTETYEGFLILIISVPNGTTPSKVLGASDKAFERFAEKIIATLPSDFGGSIGQNIKQIVVPIENILFCKKHNYRTPSYESKMNSILNNEGIKEDDATLILDVIKVTGYGHLES